MLEDFETKTDYLIETKGLLKDRINSLGGSITSGTTFRDYLVWLDSLYEALEEKTITGLPDSLEGKCEQTGTPTPTSPQPINIKTGRQVVQVCGKNLFDSSTFRQGNRIDLTNASRVFADSNYYLEQGKTYTFSTDMDTNVYRFAINISSTPFPSNTTTYDSGWKRQASFTFTASVSGYLGIIVSRVNDAHFTPSEIEGIKWQLEKGNQATIYEAYNGNTYEINLGKNLLPNPTKANYSSTSSPITVNGITATFVEGGHVILDGTATALTNFNTYSQANQGESITLPVGTYTFSTPSLPSGVLLITSGGSNNGFPYTELTSSTLSKTGNITDGTKPFNYFVIRIQSGTVLDNVDIYYQLEKGSQPTSYAPYKTPIELCKISTYQDYIFKNTTENPNYDSNLEEGQWYIHKEIGRVVLNGSETGWAYASVSQGSLFRKRNIESIANTTPYCNYFKGIQNATNRANGDVYYNADQNSLDFIDNDYTSLGSFQTWLSTHNTSVYYVLATPTTTLIEDEELINQLNEIEIFTVISEDFYN